MCEDARAIESLCRIRQAPSEDQGLYGSAEGDRESGGAVSSHLIGVRLNDSAKLLEPSYHLRDGLIQSLWISGHIVVKGLCSPGKIE